MVLQSKIMSNEEEIDSEKLTTEIESPDLEKVPEESTLVEEKSDAAADVISGEGQIGEKDIVNMESSVETVSVPEEVCFLHSITPINILAF
jgi:hypothetical protein